MEPESQVMTTEVEFEGEVYYAHYFIESGIIQTEIGGCLISKGLTAEPAEETVRELLLTFLKNTKEPPSNWVQWEGP